MPSAPSTRTKVNLEPGIFAQAPGESLSDYHHLVQRNCIMIIAPGEQSVPAARQQTLFSEYRFDLQIFFKAISSAFTPQA